MNKAELEIRERLRTDFVYYAEHGLKIKTKGQGVQPFRLNKAQLYIDTIVEKQLKELGYVRVLILKGRQQGCSTYVSGRFYFKTSQSLGKNALVMAHNSDTTNMLFNMTRMYHDKCPSELRPHTRAASAKEFDFDEIDSGYRVTSAGSKEGGRGGTVHFLHGSEVGFWVNAEELFAGVMQSIPSGLDIGGSEIFLESTSAGPGGKFYEMWQDAESGKSEYINIFTPWWWQEEYQVDSSKKKIKWDEDEIKYKEVNELSFDQLLWRRYKVSELGIGKFKREYPANAEEAFEYIESGFFDRDKVVLCARDKGFPITSIGARVGALDPAGDGVNSDNSAIGWGDDRSIREVLYLKGKDEYQLAKIGEDYIDQHDLDVLWIDAVGLGSGVYSNMKHGRHKSKVRAYKGSGVTSTFIDGKEVYANRRAESYGRLREWIDDGDIHQIPNDKKLIDEICAPLEEFDEKSGKIRIESKKDMKGKRGISSPDGLDVCAMIKCEKVRNPLTNVPKYGIVHKTSYNPLDL